MPAKRPALKEVLNEISNHIEELSDLKAIEDRINEPMENYEAYSQKKKMTDIHKTLPTQKS